MPEPSAADASEGLAPLMSAAELGLLRAVVNPRRSVLEFGCGGSTVELLAHPVERVVSVESDAAWIARLQSVAELKAPLSAGRLTILHADIGPTRAFGRPDGEEHIAKWPSYWADVWRSEALAAAPPVDLVLVDGRFRVACALNAALHTDDDALILMHDFASRAHYHAVLEHLDVVASAEQLVVLRRSRDFSVARAVDDLIRFAFASR